MKASTVLKVSRNYLITEENGLPICVVRKLDGTTATEYTEALGLDTGNTAPAGVRC
jgi:hypothetical protein